MRLFHPEALCAVMSANGIRHMLVGGRKTLNMKSKQPPP